MAIQPIDLQTLFTQMDKVGKTQTLQREGLAVQQMMHGMELQRKTEELIQSVNEAQDMGDGAQKIKDRGPRGQEDDGRKKNKEQEGPDKDEEAVGTKGAVDSVFRDPSLGRNVDISL